jgi:hypothetical protein
LNTQVIYMTLSSMELQTLQIAQILNNVPTMKSQVLLLQFKVKYILHWECKCIQIRVCIVQSQVKLKMDHGLVKHTLET